MKYSEIKKKKVLDSQGEHIGDVIDSTFDVSNNRLELKHIILGGGRIEELLERVGARPDIDPVCSVDDIDSISDKVYLKKDKDSLCKTIDKGVFAATDIRFSQLSKMKVIDADEFKLGNIIDLWFDKASHLWLVLGGGFFEELLERIHAAPDIDLLIPQDDIELITKDTIKLTKSRFQLESTCESEYDKFKRELQGKSPQDDARYSQIRLGAGGAGLSRGMA
jgi:sporulation protein YlmC with PRC-barrel domain